MEQIDIEIIGRVQGVNYRSTIEKIANGLKLKGFVENREENLVHVRAQGYRDNLEELLKWCQRGSMFSKVQAMSFKFTTAIDKFDKFTIKNTDGIIRDKLNGIKSLGKRVKNKIIGDSEITKIPNHIIIIPDGNRRWAREKNWHPWVGHMHIVKDRSRLINLFEEAKILGIKYVTFWAFSTENWGRDEKEIEVLLNMMRGFTGELLKEGRKRGIRFRHLGRKDRLPKDILEKFEKLERETESNTTLNVQFGVDYGGRDELVRAFNRMKEDEVNMISEEVITQYLDTSSEIPEADLIIRTGGEKRTSGIMMWQAHYAEFYFTNILFPDFDAEHLRMAVLDYSYRTRRFGGTSEDDLKNVDEDKLHEPDDEEFTKLSLLPNA